MGVGTTNPTSPLVVQSNGAVPRLLELRSNTPTAYLAITDKDTTKSGLVGMTGDDLWIQTGGLERLRIKKNGNLHLQAWTGIGTATPQHPLHVVAGAGHARVKIAETGGSHLELSAGGSGASLSKLTSTRE